MPSATTSFRPALAAIVLLVAVAMTAGGLYLWWPLGVALGIALGGGAVLAVGARMQSSASRVAEDDELAGRLGIAVREPVAVGAAAPAGPQVPSVPALHVQQDVSWFSSGASETEPVVVSEPEPVVVSEPEPAVASEPEPVVEAEPEPVVEAEPVAEVAEPDLEPEPVVEAEPVAEVAGPDADLEPEPAVVPEPEAVVEPAPVVAAQPASAIAVRFDEDDEAPDVIPSTDFELADEDSVRTDLDRLKAELGDDYRDFARAVRLVVSTQYASAARLQRDLDVPYSRARRLITDLEEQHFIGPKTGSLPRVVLMPKERLPEVERLLADV